MAPVHRQAHRWIRPDVYPLFAAVGIGVAAAAVIMSRKLTADPSVTMWRSKRGEDVDEALAKKYNDNWLRRSVHGRPIAILPDFATKADESKQQAKQNT
ncbi:g2133 [Coccomyxa elongata]